MILLEQVSKAVRGQTVLVTGHSGFKGGWLTFWLNQMGAKVVGVSLPPDQGNDCLYERANIAGRSQSHWVDIRDAKKVRDLFTRYEPVQVFHLAAQPLVRRSYADPLETFSTNVMGTANVLEAARHTPSVKALVCVTTDKVYHNKEWPWPYRETDALGGIDPYSASKAAAELVARAYRTTLQANSSPFGLATARGGNVVGGGDWSEDRILPDIVRALRAGDPLVLRNPQATRPWQHVLDLCWGYLLLANRMATNALEKDDLGGDADGAFNFGPDPASEQTVEQLVAAILQTWEKPSHTVEVVGSKLHESRYLRLDSSKARAVLAWRPLLNFDQTMEMTAHWYKEYLADARAAITVTEKQIEHYEQLIRTA